MSLNQASPLLLDACVVLNLYATRQLHAILDCFPNTVAIVDTVEREAQFVFRGGDTKDARERDLIDLSDVIARGLLSVIGEKTEDELLTFIDLTREMDDGEAMTAAIAIHRGYMVATDDRKAIRVLQLHHATICSTLDLIKHWAESQMVSTDLLQIVLNDLRVRGNYVPSKHHPLGSWWNDVLAYNAPAIEP